MSHTFVRLSGVVVAAALTASLLAACTPAAPPAAVETKMDVSYGSPPAGGWTWGVADISTGPQERAEDTNNHGFPWVFYVVRGSTELGTAEGKKTLAAGEAMMISTRQDHSHRFFAQSQVLAFRPTPQRMAEFHRGTKLHESAASLGVKPGQNYSLRIRNFTIPPRGSESITAEASFGYVVEGTLSIRSGDNTTTQEAGKAFELPSNVEQVLSNEGAAPVKFMLADLRP
ncbi:MAG: cupin domain-containing protein [Chloroflexi bacterium]|nr:cupin domain-containing protein [Chloroflexota bacterium]